MIKIHLVLPMGGAGSRFEKMGYMTPKPMIDIAGNPFFYWSAISVTNFIEVIDVRCVVLKRHIERWKIDSAIQSYFPEAKIIVLDDVLPGPVFSALRGMEDIEDDAPVLINDCDHMFGCEDLYRQLNQGNMEFDGGLLTFRASEPHYSYVRFDRSGGIAGTVEKKVVSESAICGAYLFRSSELFKEYTAEYIKNCLYQECYMSGVYNHLCRRGKDVRSFPLDFHVEFGTPDEYKAAQNSPRFYEMQLLDAQRHIGKQP